MLRILLDQKMIGRQEIFDYTEEASMLGDAEISVQLLEYQHAHFSMEDILAETQRRQEQAFDRMLFGMPLSATEMKKIWDTERRPMAA